MAYIIYKPVVAKQVVVNHHNVSILKTDGTVTVIGDLRNVPQKEDLAHVSGITATDKSAVALKSDGQIVCWGELDTGFNDLQLSYDDFWCMR
ncbi:hypothetical protein [Algicola sagamiensis]|uniref:hypothetical protein n=1 Tax=Algicola sagamiensis TaxID=163869 RepID=UPI00039B4701|nr:hypothetical protein [Algicola sagamiensis]